MIFFMPEFVRKIIRMERNTSTVSSNSQSDSPPETQNTSTSPPQTLLPVVMLNHTTPISRYPEATPTSPTTSPRTETSSNEAYLRLQDVALRSLGIQSGLLYSRSLHPSPTSSPESSRNSPTHGQHSYATWSTQPIPDGQNPLYCMNPDTGLSLIYLSPLNNGPKQTSTQ
ncbi:C3 [Plantago lanceolata latent virus]|uniref:C3 n=1 Tax=Plantago lanceolata latent virus TaxID=1830242 RepID=A0A166V5P1_9GEMI|nr:C3 [Plantago lanceolata latent virus]ANA76385.1 C3 [Plantago lanceolata latent virus]